jgi:hypothetical protein
MGFAALYLSYKSGIALRVAADYAIANPPYFSGEAEASSHAIPPERL